MAYSDKEIIKKIEAETRNEKLIPTVLSSKRSAFLNRARASLLTGCGDDCGVLLLTTDIPGVSFYDLNTGHLHQILAINVGAGFSYGGDLARWGNKFYLARSGGGANVVIEYEIDYTNCTSSIARTIQTTPGNFPSAAGMDMLDANTMLWGGGKIYAVDISGASITNTTTLFNLVGSISGDITYIQQSNTILTSEQGGGGGGSFLRHYDMQGGLLGQVLLPDPNDSCLGTFCSNGIVYACIYGDTSGSFATFFHPIDLTNMIILPPVNSDNEFVAGATSDPSRCDSGDCDPPSGECYNVGDIGPEGGIIFAVPQSHPHNNGVNQTNYYYEVAQNDITTGGTPSAGFNSTCGEPSWNNIGYHANAKAQIGSYGISFDTTDPANAQLVSDVNSGVISTLTVVNTAFTPTLQPMFPGTATQPGPYITNITTGPSSTILLEFNTPVIDSYYPLDTQVTFFNNTVSPGWSASGAEWGVHNKPNIATSTDFGTGHTNTDAIDAYPLSPGNPTGGIHPWLDSHDIAATLCKQTEGWFLPSYWEFREMMNQPSVVSQLGLNTSTQNSENYYWTSSHRLPSGTPIPNPDKYAWAYNTDTDALELAYRCHALSVRPIRRFKCEPCTGCDCVEYNYRDGHTSIDGGTMNGGGLTDTNSNSGYVVDPSQIHWNTTNEGTTLGTPPVTITTDSIIGSEKFHIWLNRHDVLGNVFSDADFNNHTGYTITAWDTKYNFMGKWKYSNLISLTSTSSYYSYDRPQMANGNYVVLKLEGVQHLQGDYPVVYYAGKPDVPGSLGSNTAVFFKVEWDGNTGNYETGCNSTTFGNPHPYYSPNNGKDWPYYCGPLYSYGGATGMNTSIPRYATFPPLDAAGNTLTVYPDLYTANPNYTGSIFPWNFTTGQAGSCDLCDYNVGDIGPAGGTIVATPNSPNSTYNASQVYGNIGDTGSNDSDYYYELSPVDLNDPAASHPNVEWGNFDVTNGIDLTSIVDNGGILSVDALNNGEINTADLMTTNPTAGLFFPGGPGGIPSAPELCNNYQLNGYYDWFLPSVHEWGFVRNNIPSISTGSTHLDNLYWTSNFWDTGVLGNNAPVTSGPFSCTVMGNVPPSSNDGTYSEFSALVVDVNTPSVVPPTGPGPEIMWWHWVQNGWSNAPYPEYHLAYHASRWLPSKVRAMRRFECAPIPISGCTDPMSSTYDPLATIDDGSCVYENHCWSMCGVRSGGTWYQVLDPWLDTGNPINWGPIAMENNPQPGVTTPPFSTNPAVNQDYTAFYDWIITQIPTLSIGSTFKFETPGYGMAVQTAQGLFSCDIICFKYRGVQAWNISLPVINDGYPLPTITPGSCCVGGGSSSSIVRPTSETDPKAIKMEMKRIRENFPVDGTILDIQSLY